MHPALLSLNPFGNSEPFAGETLVADGWKYQDFNPMAEEFWDMLLSVIGEGNYRLVTPVQVRRVPNDTRLFKRAQMFISPSGFSNLVAYSASGKRPQ